MSVFIVQDQRHLSDGVLKSKFDFTPALEFGELTFLLSPTARGYSPSVVMDIYRGLTNYQSTDYLLLNGNPVFIGLAFSVASRGGTRPIVILQWDKRRQVYDPLLIDTISASYVGKIK